MACLQMHTLWLVNGNMPSYRHCTYVEATHFAPQLCTRKAGYVNQFIKLKHLEMYCRGVGADFHFKKPCIDAFYKTIIPRNYLF